MPIREVCEDGETLRITIGVDGTERVFKDGRFISHHNMGEQATLFEGAAYQQSLAGQARLALKMRRVAAQQERKREKNMRRLSTTIFGTSTFHQTMASKAKKQQALQGLCSDDWNALDLSSLCRRSERDALHRVFQDRFEMLLMCFDHYSTMGIDFVFKSITTSVMKQLEADRATIWVIDFAKKQLWSKVAAGTGTQIRVPLGKGIVGATVRTGKLINIPDAYKDSRFNSAIDKKTGYHTKSILCVPARDRLGRVVGAVQVFNKLTSESFSKHDESVIIQIADRFGREVALTKSDESMKSDEKLADGGRAGGMTLPEFNSFAETMGITKRVTLQDLGNAFEDMLKRRDNDNVESKGRQGSMLINQDSLDRRTFFMLLFWVANRIFQNGETDTPAAFALFVQRFLEPRMAVHIDADIVSLLLESNNANIIIKSMKMIHRVFIKYSDVVMRTMSRRNFLQMCKHLKLYKITGLDRQELIMMFTLSTQDLLDLKAEKKSGVLAKVRPVSPSGGPPSPLAKETEMASLDEKQFILVLVRIANGMAATDLLPTLESRLKLLINTLGGKDQANARARNRLSNVMGKRRSLMNMTKQSLLAQKGPLKGGALARRGRK